MKLSTEYVGYILERQHADGSFGLSDGGDADVTAMAIQALSYIDGARGRGFGVRKRGGVSVFDPECRTGRFPRTARPIAKAHRSGLDRYVRAWNIFERTRDLSKTGTRFWTAWIGSIISGGGYKHLTDPDRAGSDGDRTGAARADERLFGEEYRRLKIRRTVGRSATEVRT